MAAVVVVQPFGLNAPPSGTTTGPALPGPPLWMCETSGFVIPLIFVKAQQTFVPVIVIEAWPLPAGAPFGTSTPPVSFVTKVFVDELRPSAAAGRTTSATTPATRTRRRPTDALPGP